MRQWTASWRCYRASNVTRDWMFWCVRCTKRALLRAFATFWKTACRPQNRFGNSFRVQKPFWKQFLHPKTFGKTVSETVFAPKNLRNLQNVNKGGATEVCLIVCLSAFSWLRRSVCEMFARVWLCGECVVGRCVCVCVKQRRRDWGLSNSLSISVFKFKIYFVWGPRAGIIFLRKRNKKQTEAKIKLGFHFSLLPSEFGRVP